jgi:polyisoprenoid-binding protein YceI
MTTIDTTTQAPSLTGAYDIDPAHSRIGFAAKHAMVTTVRGQFTDYTADVYLDEDNPAASRVRLEIKAASVESGNADRDKHLRGGDFFDVGAHPTLVFQSTKVEKSDGDLYTLIGDLTINGVTNPVSVDWEVTGATTDPWGNFRAGFEGKATVNRRDWGLQWNVGLDKGGVLVGEKVKLEFDISAVKRAS